MTLFSTLVRCGTAHPTGVLEFCQCVGDLLDRNAQFMSNAEVLWRLWSVVANTLQEHISKVGPWLVKMKVRAKCDVDDEWL